MNKADLLAFEERVKEAFCAGKIRAPVHLCGGNEDQLIQLFEAVHHDDWVFSTWRSHYHALLHGIPQDWLWKEVLSGRSMYLSNKEHHFFSSAIVGGILPIAVGVAMGLKMKRDRAHVWCFVGDMAAEHGAYHEATKYANRHALDNITFVIEDNGLSTNTPTQVAWGELIIPLDLIQLEKRYFYERTVPHVGAGKWVVFQ